MKNQKNVRKENQNNSLPNKPKKNDSTRIEEPQKINPTKIEEPKPDKSKPTVKPDNGNNKISKMDIAKPIRKGINCMLIIFVSATLISWNTFFTKGPHGGKVEKADDFFIEMKSTEKVLYVYLLDEKLRTISSKGISGEAKLFFSDSTTLNVQLKPIGEDAFTSEAALRFYACKITFQVFGKSVSAKFDNPVLIVLEK